MSRAVEFGADGIRGVAGEWPLVPQAAVGIGRALGRFLRDRASHPVAVIGRDTRPSGEFLSRGLREGLLSCGIDVIDLGVMTTPGVAYLTRRLDAALGVIVSASHNPAQYNGIKLVGPHGLRLQREDEIEVESYCSDLLVASELPEAGNGEKSDASHLKELYLEDHVLHYPVDSLTGLRLVIDCANGASSVVASEAFSRLGAEVIVINDETSGSNINLACGSEHVRSFPRDLAAIVQQHGATYGFAFDGDGDRLVVVDSDGHVFDGDDLLYLFATHMQSQNLLRGNMVVTTRSGNSGLEICLESLGIQTIFTGKGDKSLEAAMWNGDYLLGGEQTGNIILNDGAHTAADAIYVSLVLAGILARHRDARMIDLVGSFQKLPQVVASVHVIRKPALDHILPLQLEKKRLLETLGPRCRAETWYSTTEPDLFRVMVEGTSQNTSGEVEKAAKDLCQVVQRATQSENSKIALLRVSSRSR